MEVTLVAVAGFMTVMFCRIFATGFGYVVTTLTNTGTLVICIFTLAAGITEIYGTGHAALFHVSTYQVNVRSLGVGGIFGVILHMSTMTVTTLNILVFAIVALFVRMAVRTDVEFVRRSAGYLGTAAISTQLITVTGTQVCVIALAFSC